MSQVNSIVGSLNDAIDYILGRGLPESAVVTERQVDTSTAASDHCPLWVSLAWKK